MNCPSNKVPYKKRSVAERARKKIERHKRSGKKHDHSIVIYGCVFCGQWHIGHRHSLAL